jgi:hypothetical protein
MDSNVKVLLYRVFIYRRKSLLKFNFRFTVGATFKKPTQNQFTAASLIYIMMVFSYFEKLSARKLICNVSVIKRLVSQLRFDF